MTRDEALAMLRALVDDGWLLGVGVFGDESCCLHGDPVPEGVDCPVTGFGLCDNMNEHSPGGSDCNRAERFLMRPHDDLMVTTIYDAIKETL